MASARCNDQILPQPQWQRPAPLTRLTRLLSKLSTGPPGRPLGSLLRQNRYLSANCIWRLFSHVEVIRPKSGLPN